MKPLQCKQKIETFSRNQKIKKDIKSQSTAEETQW